MQEIIDWEKEWKEKTKEERKNANRFSGIDYWNKRAEDYADYITTSNYEHGRKIRELFEKEGVLKPEFEVLDIAAGPGSVTIPFAEVVKKVTAVEPAEEMIKHLVKNAQEKEVQNIEIINKKWEEVNDAKFQEKFDLVICSHAIWQFPNIKEHITRMNKVLRGYCCIATSVRTDKAFGKMYKKLGIATESFDRFIYLFNILHQNGILANVKMVDTVMRRSVRSAISMWELFLSKYREPTKNDKEIIRRHVLVNSENGMYKKKGKMAVVWWKKKQWIT